MANNSTQLEFPAGYQKATLTIEAYASGSTISATASLNCGGAYWYGFSSCILSVEIDGNQVGAIAPDFTGHNQTKSVSGSRSVSDGNHTVTAKWTNPTTNVYICYSGSISTSVRVSTASKATLSLGKTELYIGEVMPITITKHGANPSSLTWSFLGNSGSVGMLSSGNWTIPNDVFEPLMQTSETLSVVVTITLTTSGYGSDAKTFTLKVPENYIPSLNIEKLIKHNTILGYLIAGASYLEIDYSAISIPSDKNTATIEIVRVRDYTLNPNIGAITFSEDLENDKIVSSVLPTTEDYSGYDLTVNVEAIDSRGRTSVISLSPTIIGRIYSYMPPRVSITDLFRCDVSGAQKTSGTYAYIETIIENAGTLVTNQVQIGNGVWQFQAKTGVENTYYCIAGNGNLAVGSQYDIIVSVLNQKMQDYGDPAVTISNILPTMQMPISFYDDDQGVVGVSVGEMATNYEETEDKPFLNLSRELMIRASNSLGDVAVRDAYELLTMGICPFPVGSIFLTLEETDPSEIWAGTYWELLNEGQFLISAGEEYEVGTTGGEAEHTLTIAEMPSHTHTTNAYEGLSAPYGTTSADKTIANNSDPATINSTGGGEPHNNIPPYLSVYMWKRVEEEPTYYFTVLGVEYEYEEGMNWSQFINSIYNPTLLGDNKLFISKNLDGDNVVFIGEVINNEAVYDKYLSLNGVSIKSNNRIINHTIYNVVDTFWDLIDEEEYDEIDFIYTTDIHGCWKGYQDSPRTTTNFAYSNNVYKNVIGYRELLESDQETKIKVLCIDGGDYCHYSGTGRLINNGYGIDAINQMNTVGYFASTIGNHEYKAGEDGDYGPAIIDNVLKKMTGGTDKCSVIACNLLYKSTGETVFKPYKTAKIGSRKIAVIGVAFAGADGDTTAWEEGYTFIDGTDLYNLIQDYIDELKSKGIEYIIVLAHLGLGPDGSGRCVASCQEIIENTSGLLVVTPAHSHSADAGGVFYNDKDGNPVLLATQPQCDFAYITRIRLKSDGVESSKLSTY